jgi:hypothetical protein
MSIRPLTFYPEGQAFQPGGKYNYQRFPEGATLINPQAVSQAQADATRANVLAQQEAIGRDANYTWKLPTEQPATNWDKLGGTRTDMGKIDFVNPFATPVTPEKSKFQLGDIWTAWNPSQLSKPSGSLTTQQQRDILTSKVGNKEVFNPLKIFDLPKAQRDSVAQAEYQNKLAEQKIAIGMAQSATGPGFIYGIDEVKSEGLGFSSQKFFSNFKTTDVNKLQNPFIVEKTNYVTSFGNVDLEKAQTNLKNKGINLNFDKVVTEKEVAPGYSFTEGDTTYTMGPTIETNKSFSNIGFSSPMITNPSLSFFDKAVKSGEMSNLKATTLQSIGKGTEMYAKGLATYATFGLLGGPAAVEYIGVGLGKYGAGTGLALKVLIGAGAVTNVGVSAYQGYKTAESKGLDPFATAVRSGTSAAAGQVGMLIGASGNELSPIRVQDVVVNRATGDVTTKSLGFVNPFGRSGFAVGSYTKGEGLRLGSFKPSKSASFLKGGELEVGNQLGLQVYKQTIPKVTNAAEAKELFSISEKVLPLTNKLPVPGKSTVDISKNKFFDSLSAPEQKEFLKIIGEVGKDSGKFSFGGLGRVIKETAFGGRFSSGKLIGLERGFGSTFVKAEGGITRAPGDIDINFYGKAIPKIQTIADRLNLVGKGNWMAKEGKVSYKGEKVIEAFGSDTLRIDAAPLAFKGQFPKQMNLAGGGNIAGQTNSI